MRRLCLLALLSLVLLLPTVSSSGARAKKKRLLVVTVTKGFRHSDSIPVAERVIAELGEKSGKFTVDYVRTDEEMARKMSPEGLKEFDGVFFASTTGDLPIPDRDAFLKWIAAGHGYAGAHAAADTLHGFPPYIEMLGGEFLTHGAQVEVEGLVDDPKHPATKAIDGSVKVFDEIYLYKSYDRAKVHLLLGMDKHPNDKTPGHYPLAWCKEYGRGKVFYTALGHRPDVWEKPWFQQHVQGGILWSLGLERGSAKLPSSR